jgi:hypothetical protein
MSVFRYRTRLHTGQMSDGIAADGAEEGADEMPRPIVDATLRDMVGETAGVWVVVSIEPRSIRRRKGDECRDLGDGEGELEEEDIRNKSRGVG